MTYSNSRIHVPCWLASLGIVAVLIMPAGLHAQTAGAAKAKAAEQSKRHAIQNVVVANDDDGQKHTIEIRVDDGKVTVMRDGKVIPNGQITQDDGHIIVTDKDGHRLDNIDIAIQGRPGMFGYSFGGEGDAPDFRWDAFRTDESDSAPAVMLGVHMTDPPTALLRHLGLEPDTATMINGVYKGLPAETAGLAEYDVITKVNGESPANSAAIRNVLAEKQPGDAVTFTVIHEGKPRELTVTLAKYDRKVMDDAELIGSGGEDMLWSAIAGPLSKKELTFKAAQGQFPRVFVAPDGHTNPQLELFMPKFETLRERGISGADIQAGDLEQRLKQLDERMAELDKVIQKLIEQQSRKP